MILDIKNGKIRIKGEFKMEKHSVYKKELIEKLFYKYKNQKWVNSYFDDLLENCIGKNGKIENIIKKTNKIELISNKKYELEFHLLDENFSEKILFAYKVTYPDDKDVTYGVVAIIKDEIIDLYCNPHSNIKDLKNNYFITVFNIKTLKRYTKHNSMGTNHKLNEVFNNLLENAIKKEELNILINKMLIKEKLLLKNTISRVF